MCLHLAACKSGQQSYLERCESADVIETRSLLQAYVVGPARAGLQQSPI
jgi:hypothetical protein